MQRWDPTQSVAAGCFISEHGTVGILFQGTDGKPVPLAWAYQNTNKAAFVTIVAVLALLHFGKEPDTILVCWKQQLWENMVARSEDLQCATFDFPGSITTGKGLQWITHLKTLQLQLTLPLSMRPLQGTTYFTDTSSPSQTAAVVWKTEGRWEKRM